MSWEQVTGGVGVIGGIAIGYLSHRRSRKVDAVSEQSGIAADTRAGVAQAFEELTSLARLVQDDNQAFRDDLKQCNARFEGLTMKYDALNRQLVRMHRKYGENGNGTPPPQVDDS